MTRYEMRKRAERAETLAVAFGMLLAVALVVGAFVVGVKVGENKDAERVRQAQAQAYDEGAEFGNSEGWRECIEENNLYDRYMRSAERDTSRV